MTLAEIQSIVQGAEGVRYQFSPNRLLAYLNQIQQTAYAKDLEAFLDWSQTVTLTQTVPGTADKGPYAFPSGCRKIMGITRATDADLFGVETSNTTYDYGLYVGQYDPSRKWERIRQDRTGSTRTITFIETPDLTATYRWVFYRRAPTIVSWADDGNLRIPAEYHHDIVVQGLLALCNTALYGQESPQAVLAPYLEPYWEEMRTLNTPMGGENDYGISEGTPC